MVTGYTKLHGGIITSTIWREDPATKVIWITLLALANRDGVVEATIPGLAAIANVSIEQTETAVQKFLSPDKYSRTPDLEGRRIAVVDGGWLLLNYEKYREKLSKEDLNARNAARQQRYRDRLARNAERNATVTERNGDDLLRLSRQSEPESQSEAVELKTLAHSPNEPLSAVAPEVRPYKFPSQKRRPLAADLYRRYPRKVGKADAEKAFAKAVGDVARRGVTEKHTDFAGDEQAAARWIGDRIDLYANSEQVKQADKNLIPYPATWANAGRFDDDEADWNRPRSSGRQTAQSSPAAVAPDYSVGFSEVLKRPQPEWAASRSGGAQ